MPVAATDGADGGRASTKTGEGQGRASRAIARITRMHRVVIECPATANEFVPELLIHEGSGAYELGVGREWPLQVGRLTVRPHLAQGQVLANGPTLLGVVSALASEAEHVVAWSAASVPARGRRRLAASRCEQEGWTLHSSPQSRTFAYRSMDLAGTDHVLPGLPLESSSDGIFVWGAPFVDCLGSAKTCEALTAFADRGGFSMSLGFAEWLEERSAFVAYSLNLDVLGRAVVVVGDLRRFVAEGLPAEVWEN